jgi:ATP-binding cassette subfamily B protein
MKQNYFKEFIHDVAAILRMIANISKSFLPIIIFKNVLQAFLPFINIIFSYRILDGLIDKIDRNIVLEYVYWLIGLNLILGISLSFLTRYLNVRTEFIHKTITSNLARKALTMDYEQLEKKESLLLLHKAKEGSISHGDMMSFCNNIGRLLSHLMTLIYSGILLSSLFYSNSKVNDSSLTRVMKSPVLVIILFLLFIIALLINFKIIQKMMRLSYAFFEKNVDNNRKFFYFMQLANNYKLGKDIRLYHMSGMIEEEMDLAFAPAEETMKELGKTLGTCIGLTEVVNQAVIYLIYGYVGVKAILGLFSVGSILKYVSALVKLIGSISAIIEVFANFDLQRKYLKNYCDFLNIENKKYEGSLPVEKRDDNEYELEFKNVFFHYPNSDEEILKNISMKLKVGRKMAIVGRNGAGKTTFIKLLSRLYDPTEGEILLNGIDIKKYDYEEFLKIFSVVFQDFKLFSFDIGQNVAASLALDERKAWEVLMQAGVAERIKNMEHGLKTNLYQTQEDGIEISGGEAQKIAIARALYKDAPVVILDEPTSALDPVSEYEIYARFDDLVLDKTSIYISHRMSSCRFCDNIVVFDDGQIVQTGSHDDLMKEENGLYHALWTAQAKYYTA